MPKLSRRNFIAAAAGGAAACMGGTLNASSEAEPAPGKAVIHVTDLFRPYADADDHWDLACVFALAFQGRFELAGVMIDHPPEDFERDPDVQAVAQMNAISGLAVPVFIGSPLRLEAAEAARPENILAAGGARALLSMMSRSRHPVVINIIGSSRDVALAGRLDPGLFEKKCAGVYLNAGSGTPDKTLAARLEYNVALDPASYAGIFELPCPVYWMPCHQVSPAENDESFTAGPYGTYYRFPQKDILPFLSARVRNYFAFMFKQGSSERAYQHPEDALRPNWLRALEGPPDKDLIERQARRIRNMWCTAGFFHAAGLSVAADGTFAPGASVPSPLFTFDPVRVRCDAAGITTWVDDPGSRDRFLFHVRDEARYPGAMAAAMRGLLESLP
jgi:hypothetical protein